MEPMSTASTPPSNSRSGHTPSLSGSEPMMPPEGDPFGAFRKVHIGYLFQQLSRDFDHRVRATLREQGHVGLQPSHQSVFAGLDIAGTRLTKLASRASMTKQAMGQLVDDLERLGYVERIPDTRDGRAKIVRLTDSGRAFLRDTAEVFASVWSEYAALLGERELINIQDRLDVLLEGTRAAQTP